MSLLDKQGHIWIDGEYIEWQDAKVHCLTNTFHYGVGAFEGVRAYQTKKGTAIFRLDKHTDRLFNSAKILDMKVPFDKEEITQAQCEIIKKNNLTAAYLRPMIYYGGEYLGLQTDSLSVHVMVAAWEWGAYLGEGSLEKGVKLGTSSFTRNHVNSVLCKAKANGNYINSILAQKEAHASGFDEALMLDHQGCVAEGTGENIFVIKNEKIFTPDRMAILEGITRETIMQLATELGYSVEERRITRDEVYCADEAFFTGTAAEVTPISAVDGRLIGDGKRGPITEKLQTLYLQEVRGEGSHDEWLTYV